MCKIQDFSIRSFVLRRCSGRHVAGRGQENRVIQWGDFNRAALHLNARPQVGLRAKRGRTSNPASP